MFKRFLAAAALTATVPFAAVADSSFSGAVALTSDYVFRGYSQTDENPAFQPAINWVHDSGIHINAWASNVDFNDGGESEVEVDLTLGYSGEKGGLTYDFGAVAYIYPGSAGRLNYNYWEFYSTLGGKVGDATVTGSFNFTPDNFGGLDTAAFFALSAVMPVADKVSMDVSFGTAQVKKSAGQDYEYWSAGATYALGFADVSLRYHDTNASACLGLCTARAVLTLSKGF
jgi:uncharacterized protein (TIGR02001 family)